MNNIGSYEERIQSFNWTVAEEELGLKPEDPINIGWFCCDRICAQGKGNKLALVYRDMAGIDRVYTFNDLQKGSNKIANYLKINEIAPGDRVCLFMDRIPELYFSFLAILKIGAIAQPLFSAFGDESLYVRLADAGTRMIITQRKYLSKIRKIREKLSLLKLIVVVDCPSYETTQTSELYMNVDEIEDPGNMKIFTAFRETPSVLHYTSGTTGLPKGVLHVHGSLISQYITAKWVLDLNDDDRYWCTADPGWVTGISYGIIGPWSIGVTQFILNSGFTAGAWYKFIEDHKITVWYTAPTAVRSLMKAGSEIAGSYDLSSLRHLACVGEPLNAEAVIWSSRVFGKPFHDTYWQTETGSIIVSNYPGMNVKPGSMGKPFPGITCRILDAKCYEPMEHGNGKVGLIACLPDWPAIMRKYWNNEEKFHEKFRNGWYLTGDRAYMDKEGYFWFVGRDDDVINTGGHLVSPFEIESALLEHESVAESAVVSKPDEINMEVVKAFVTLNPGFAPDEDLKLEIMNFIRKKLSPIAMPQEIEFVDSLPRTRSGKIMRRLLKAREWGEEIGDISTLEND